MEIRLVNTWHRIAAITTFGLVMSAPGAASAQGNSSAAPAPAGAWLTTVTFQPNPSGPVPPPFKEILTLHAGGTVSETNTTLSAASGLLPPPFNLVGSEGYGTWQHARSGKIALTVTKLVFCGEASLFCSQFGKTPGEQFGYLQVRMTASISGDTLTVNPDPAESSTTLFVGDDLDSPMAVIPFGAAAAEGTRLH